MRHKLALCLAFLPFALPACAERRIAAGSPPPDGTALTSPFLASSAEAPTPDLLPGAALEATAVAARTASWIDAVRLERWADAATRIDALPDTERARPEMRYVRARAAIGAGDSAR